MPWASKLLREKFRPFLYRIVEALDRDHISKSDSSERKMDKLVEATSNISVSSAKRTGLTLEEINTEAASSESPTRIRFSWNNNVDGTMDDTAPAHVKLSLLLKDVLLDVKNYDQLHPRHPSRVRTYGTSPSFPGLPRTACPIPKCRAKFPTEFQRDLHYLRKHIWKLGSRYDKENESRETAYIKTGKNEDGSWFGAENYCLEPETELAAEEVGDDFQQWKEEYTAAGFSRSDFVPVPKAALRWEERQIATFSGHISAVPRA